MVHLKTAEEIQIIRESAQILAQTHGEVARLIKPGVKTKDLDKRAEEFIRDKGGIPSFLKYNGFPASLCISVNDVVVHGIPGEYELKETDVVTIDSGVQYKGYHSDSAYTYPLEGASPEVLKLLERTYQSLYLGIAQAKAGKVTQARDALRRALALKSDFNGAADARKALAELEQGTAQ